MTDNDLSRRLNMLGFPLFENRPAVDVSRTLADVVKTRDARLWEGFPVIMANSAEDGSFDYDKTLSLLKKADDKTTFESLVALSLGLYDKLKMNFSWKNAVYNLLSPSGKKEYGKLVKMLNGGCNVKIKGIVTSSQRLEEAFRNYFMKRRGRLNELLMEKDELGLEYALSQIFSPKQKELFLKRLKGEKLAKTEAEYFSRVVKKKVAALANTELHRLARKLL